MTLARCWTAVSMPKRRDARAHVLATKFGLSICPVLCFRWAQLREIPWVCRSKQLQTVSTGSQAMWAEADISISSQSQSAALHVHNLANESELAAEAAKTKCSVIRKIEGNRLVAWFPARLLSSAPASVSSAPASTTGGPAVVPASALSPLPTATTAATARQQWQCQHQQWQR